MTIQSAEAALEPARWWRSPRMLARWSLRTGFLLGALAGLLAWNGVGFVMDQTNTLEFCVSCHAMEATVYQEYKASVHYQNHSGVRVACPDCHVPKEWGAKLVRKIQASADVLHTVLGTIDTPEKFEAKRLVMAERVWATMRETNSRECRNCHSYEAMAFHKQRFEARQKMEAEAAPKNQSCIDCHKGIAHKYPRPPRDDD